MELIGGVERRVIEIVPWSHTWARRFARERDRILGALGPVRVEHIGSTAVPGLAAKPVVDIQISVEEIEDEVTYVPALERAGYLLRVREPAHRMLRTPERDVHVHVCGAGSEWEQRHLAFRDWLRHDHDDRRAYAHLKRQLAARDWPDMNAYADAKSSFIVGALARAATADQRRGGGCGPD